MMCETLVGRWGWAVRDLATGTWLLRRVRFTSLREAQDHVAHAQALGLVARVVDHNPPRPVIRMLQGEAADV